MGNYKRNITYFYQYHNGRIGATTGFLKMEVRGDIVGITINIQEGYNIHNSNPVLCFYHEALDNLSAVKICEVERCGEMLTFHTKTSWEKLFDTGRDLYSFDGVIVLYNKNDYYLGDFKDRDRSSYELTFNEDDEKKNNNNEKSGKTEDEISVETDGETTTRKETKIPINTGAEISREKVSVYNTGYKNEAKNGISPDDSFDSMIKDFPKLSMGGVQELFDCVRINLKDIGKLDISNWKLGANSFLTHGYYTYKYLMLGNMRFDNGKNKAVLGVPGVFSNREKYLANMFGFYQFIPVRKNGLKTGQFGYWIVELITNGDHC